jgi:hypothetical protein
MHARNKQTKKSNQHEKDCLVGGVSIYTKKYTERQRYRRTAPLCSAFFFLTRSSKSESDIKSNQIVLDPNQKKENIKPNQIKTEKNTSQICRVLSYRPVLLSSPPDFLTRSSKTEPVMRLSNQIVLNPNQKKQNIKPNQMKSEKSTSQIHRVSSYHPVLLCSSLDFFDSLLWIRIGYQIKSFQIRIGKKKISNQIK